MDIKGVTDVLSELHDMLQDAKGALLQPEKCVINRDEALNLIEETIDQLPSEIKSARTIVEARNELIAQGKKEAEKTIIDAKDKTNEMIAKAKADAEAIVAEAKEKAENMISKESVYLEAKARGQEMIEKAQKAIDNLKEMNNNYVINSMKETEAAIEKSLNDIKKTRAKFSEMAGIVEKRPEKKLEEERTAAFFQDISVD